MIMFPECEMRVIAFFGLQGNVGCLPQAFDVLVDMSRRLHCEPNLLSGAGQNKGAKQRGRSSFWRSALFGDGSTEAEKRAASPLPLPPGAGCVPFEFSSRSR
jgi:hypothetical protein